MTAHRLIRLLAALTLLVQPGTALAQAAPWAPAPVVSANSLHPSAPAAPAVCGVVSSTADAGAGSLREAVACIAPGGTVTFAGGLAGQTITVASQIDITHSLTIDGSGAAGVRVDGNNASRVFQITAGGPVTVSALILQRGNTPGSGGAVYADSASPLVLSQVSVFTSTAGGNGGGLYTDSTVVLSGTEFISNTSASYGGGVWALGAATLLNGRFERNACTPTYCRGGGLLASSTLAVTGTEFISNTTGYVGGGVYTEGAVTLTNGRFQGNACTPAACLGGGLYAASTLILNGTEFISNTSSLVGGGAYVSSAGTLTGGRFQGNACTQAACLGGGLLAASTLILSGTEFISNTSGSYGGGAYITGTATLTNGRFERNACTQAACSGGGLYTASTLSLSGTEFISNTTGGTGGGAYAFGAVTLTNGRFQGNFCIQVSCQGGGLFTFNSLTLKGTEFINNNSTSLGGGALAMGAVTLTNGRFQGNTCTLANCQGGGLYTNSTLALTGTEFVSNTSTSLGGGTLAAGAVTLTNGLFQGNACTQAACQGGGLFTYNALTLSGTEFITNNSTSHGGGAYVSSIVTLTGGRFERNACTQAACYGGGLYTASTLSLSGTEFISNTSTRFGGGAYALGAATLTNGRFERNACTQAACQGGGLVTISTLALTGTEFISNTSTSHGGGALASHAVTLTNASFQGNTCTETGCEGGGLYTNGGGLIDRSTFSGNTADLGGGVVVTHSGAALTLTNVTLSGNTAGVGGGGLYVHGTASAYLLNVTLANNAAPSGAGLLAAAGATVGITNTLFADNGASTCVGPIAFGTHNLEWPGTTCATAGPSAGFTSADPLLDVLGLNAPGTTWTHALLNNSPARDAGHAATCAGPLVNNRDQRGATRPIDGDLTPGAVCDIGAYEAGPPVWFLYLPLVSR